MSNASRQALTLISVAHGAVRSLRELYEVGPVFQARVTTCDQALIKLLNAWPATGSAKENIAYAVSRISAWDDYLKDLPPGWSLTCLVNVAMQALTDLESNVGRPRKAMIAPVLPCLQAIIDDLDPKGLNFEAMEHADAMLGRLYTILEFKP
jgi:hypothetical protein